MDANASCRQCGEPLTNAVQGLCPRCLMELGVALDATPGDFLPLPDSSITDTGATVVLSPPRIETCIPCHYGA
jgi:hypothetical protein